MRPLSSRYGDRQDPVVGSGPLSSVLPDLVMLGCVRKRIHVADGQNIHMNHTRVNLFRTRIRRGGVTRWFGRCSICRAKMGETCVSYTTMLHLLLPDRAPRWLLPDDGAEEGVVRLMPDQMHQRDRNPPSSFQSLPRRCGWRTADESGRRTPVDDRPVENFLPARWMPQGHRCHVLVLMLPGLARIAAS